MGEEVRVIGLSRQEVNQGWARNTLIPREKLSPVPEIAPFLVMGLDRTVVLSRLARKAEKMQSGGNHARKCSLKRSRAGVGLRISSTVWNMSLVLLGAKTIMKF